MSTCYELDSENSEYVLENDISAEDTCFLVTANNITIDCSGYTITYGTESPGYGIFISGVNNAIVKNCILVKDNSAVQESAGIYEELSNGSLLFNNTVNSTGDHSYGILLQDSYFANITGNAIYTSGNYAPAISLSSSGLNNLAINAINTADGNDDYGIIFSSSAYNSVAGNIINTNGSYNSYGIFLSSGSDNNSISQNSVFAQGSEDSNFGIYSSGSVGINVSQNNVTTRGTYWNLGIRLIESGNSLVSQNSVFAQGISGDNYGVVVSSSVGVNVSQNNVTTNGAYWDVGIFLVESGNSLVSQNSVFAQGSENDNYGAYVYGSVGVNVSGNVLVTFGSRSNHGVYLSGGSDSCVISLNSVFAQGSENDNYGVFLSSSSNVNVIRNNVTTNGTYDNDGIYASESPGSNLVQNNVTTGGISSNFGIKLATGSDNSLISQNIVVANGTEGGNYGIEISESSGINIDQDVLATGGTYSNFGIFMVGNADNSIISKNNITTASTGSSGIYLLSSSSANITGNIIQAILNLSFAIQLEDSANNLIFNNVLNTTEGQVNVSSEGVNNFSTALVEGTNIIGYSYIGGNYYDNSTVGGLKGFSCSDADRNGICDSAYQIAENSTDYYPLTIPVPAPPEAEQGTDGGGDGGSRGAAGSHGGGVLVKKPIVAAPKAEPQAPAPLPQPVVVAQEAPAQLFDIKLELEGNVLYDSRNLTAWVTFESFGSEPTPVNVTYAVLDGPGNEIYSENASVTVYTGEVIIKRFDRLSISPGNYTLVLKTIYNSNVTDEFRQGFEVVEARKAGQNLLLYVLALAVLLVIIVFFSWKYVFRRNGLEKIRQTGA